MFWLQVVPLASLVRHAGRGAHLAAFYSKARDEAGAVDAVALDFSRAFHNISCNILTKQLMKYRLEQATWIETELGRQAPSTVISGTESC